MSDLPPDTADFFKVPRETLDVIVSTLVVLPYNQASHPIRMIEQTVVPLPLAQNTPERPSERREPPPPEPADPFPDAPPPDTAPATE